MVELGSWSITAAFAVGSITFLLSLASVVRKDPLILKMTGLGAFLTSSFTTLAGAGLITAFIAGDYGLSYVWGHSDRDMPLFYKIGAFWGGQEGSLLFWALILGLFNIAFVIKHRRDAVEWYAPTLSTIIGIFVVFLAIVLFIANPFERIPGGIPIDGRGLNPLLQHPSMIIHPPALYIGFIGMVVPFAMAIGALISGRLDNEWIRKTRPWAVLAWIFLGAGNVIGARWAYVELGWGGYWAWDPVENASFIPWLVATAYLHSVMMQERHGMLKIWNMILVLLMFILTILGTFITRSGLISSVHSFAKSSIGYFLAAFLIVLIVFSFGLLIRRLPRLRSEQQIDSFFSRESFFLMTNVVLLLAAFAVLWGTFTPAVTELLRGRQISVGPQFFNRIIIPLGLILLFLMGLGPLLPFRRIKTQSLIRVVIIPCVTAAVGGMILLSFGIRGWAWGTHLLCIFVAMSVFQMWVGGVLERHNNLGEPIPTAIFKLMMGNRRRFGGQVVHFGVLIVFLGFSGNAFKKETDAFLLPGESMQLSSYTLTYLGLEEHEFPGMEQVGVNLLLSRGEKNLAVLYPQKNWYAKSKQSTSEVAIYSRLTEDFYVVFAGFEGEKISIRAFINPLVQLFWIGCIVMGLGAVFAVFPNLRRTR